MEPPLQQQQQPQAPPLSTTPHLSYQDSVDSSPRSRTTENWDDPIPQMPGGSKLRLMCSYGGHIVPRPHDKSLCYVGGDTRMVVVDRHTSLSDLSSRLSKTLLHTRSFTLKYQLPNEDLDSLISVTTDEDLDNMIDEYDRICANNSSAKFSRIRLFLFPTKPESTTSTIEIGSIFDSATKTDDWFLSALNGATGALDRGFSDSQSVNCLLGLDHDVVTAGGGGGGVNGGNDGSLDGSHTEFGGGGGGGGGGGVCKNLKQGGQDIHSVPDSPMLDTTSSFGSTSSSPSLANLPPIRVHVEDGGGGGGLRVPDHRLGIEEQFARITVAASAASAQKQDESFAGLSSPSPPQQMPTSVIASAVTSAVPMSSGGGGGGGEYQNRVYSDDERSEQQGMPVGYRRPPQPQPQTLLQNLTLPQQSQPKPTGGVELPSPDSVSSDGSLTNAMYRQKPMTYQDQKPMNITDPNTRIQQIQQQVQESGYIMQSQMEQQQQQQQFIHAGTHYIQQHPSGQVPMSSYYPVYPPQQQHHHQQLDQQYPVYYMPARQTQQAYNMSMQQSNFSEALPANPLSRSQTPPNPGMLNTPATYNPARNAPPPKTEMAAGVYRTAAAPPLVQVAPNQHQQQYVGYSQVHHPSQSMAPASAATGNYAYEFADPSHAQVYYTQPYGQPLPAQYQTMTSASAVGLPDASSQPITDQMKQQIRTTQAL